jgi:hypothetical protein
MGPAVVTPLFGMGAMLTISITVICNTWMVSRLKNTSSKCPKSTPIDARLTSTRVAMNQPIGTAPAAVMRLFRTVTTLITSSTDACIIRMAIIAMIMGR